MKLKVTLTDGLTKADYSDECIASQIKEKYPHAVFVEVTLRADPSGGYFADCTVDNVRFERIRRITGYL